MSPKRRQNYNGSVEIIVQYFNLKDCLRGINHRVCKNATQQDFSFWYQNIDSVKQRVYLCAYLEACYDMHYLLWHRYAVALHVFSSHDTYRPLCQCKQASVCKGSRPHKKGLSMSVENKNITIRDYNNNDRMLVSRSRNDSTLNFR